MSLYIAALPEVDFWQYTFRNEYSFKNRLQMNATELSKYIFGAYTRQQRQLRRNKLSNPRQSACFQQSSHSVSQKDTTLYFRNPISQQKELRSPIKLSPYQQEELYRDTTSAHIKNINSVNIVNLLMIYIAEYCVKHRTLCYDKLSCICITQFQMYYYVKLYNLSSSNPCTEILYPSSGACACVYNVINETLGIIVSTVVVNKCKMNRLLSYYIVKH